jgi:hypothetical protein
MLILSQTQTSRDWTGLETGPIAGAAGIPER